MFAVRVESREGGRATGDGARGAGTGGLAIGIGDGER